MSKQVFIPKNCPSCDTKLILNKTGVDLLCPNFSGCKAQIVGRLTYFAQRSIGSITGLSEKQIGRFVDDLNVHDLPDLFDLDYDLIKQWDGFGQKSVENLQNSIDRTRESIPDYKFLAGLGLEGVGPEVAKLICQRLGELSYLA